MGKSKPKSGAVLLATWLEKNKVTLAAFAADAGCSKQAVGAIRSGAFKPGLALAVRIERATKGKVPTISWA